MKYIFPLVALLICFSLALNGYVYDITLEKVPYAVVSVYSSSGALLSRELADQDAFYNISLNPGDYRVVVYKPGTNMWSDENVSVISINQRYDVILSPRLDYEPLENLSLPGLGEIPDISSNQLIPGNNERNNKSSNILVTILIFLISLVFGLLVLFFVVKKRKSKVKPSDEEQVLELIIERGGEMKQKEIVKETGWSEAKVSLVLKELKRKGKIRKKKIGREKIVYLEDRFLSK